VLSGSETVTSSVGECGTSVAALAGETTTGESGGWGTAGASNPVVHVWPPTVAPVTLLPEASASEVPKPSFMFQTPRSPLCGVVIAAFFAAWIWARLRALFQMRTSSTAPAKKPAASFVVRSALPTAVIAFVSAFAGLPTEAVASRTPSRYRFQVEPS
jgi:hypothetical protein